MYRARYCGPIQKYRRRMALLRIPEGEPFVLAQFDDRSMPEAFGWHPFPRHYFEDLVELTDDK